LAEAVEHGWSRSVIALRIENGVRHRSRFQREPGADSAP
jgi:hypothetical protein